MSTPNIYIRVLIFTLILSAACVALLWLSTLAVLKPFSYLWLTVAIGMFAVVIYTIISTYQYRAEVRQRVKNVIANSQQTSCPDYWTLNPATGVCGNTFVSADNRFEFHIGGSGLAPVAATAQFTEQKCDASKKQPKNSYPYTHMEHLCKAHAMGATIANEMA